jgi:hypothetical protein
MTDNLRKAATIAVSIFGGILPAMFAAFLKFAIILFIAHLAAALKPSSCRSISMHFPQCSYRRERQAAKSADISVRAAFQRFGSQPQTRKVKSSCVGAVRKLGEAWCANG